MIHGGNKTNYVSFEFIPAYQVQAVSGSAVCAQVSFAINIGIMLGLTNPAGAAVPFSKADYKNKIN